MHQNNNNDRINSMKKNYNQLFQIEVDNCDGLENDIMNSINTIKHRNMRIKQILYSSLSVISLLGLVYSGNYVFNLLVNSGIYEYMSLIFVNMQVLAYWKELSYSIIESLPFFELAILMGLISIFMWSLRKITRIQIINNYGTKITY